MVNRHNNWLTLSEQYLKTSKLIMSQCRTNKNAWAVISDNPIKWEDYFEKTQWSDFNTLVPSLFLLQHGLELLVKGLLVMLNIDFGREHDLNALIEKFNNNSYIESEFLEIIIDYAGINPENPILKDFVNLNQELSKSSIHVKFRYPEFKGKETDFSPFRYRGTELLEHIDQIIDDIDKIIEMSLKIVRKYEKSLS
ncbi:HEPN domain-containing protein [Paenibacillus sp. NRS-1760]|uniref:HEPN domain-containing protein n=1 Tax=Paenibacillus sp. NRS-1760 TaxID=3233902 RepID=UPI003D296B13